MSSATSLTLMYLSGFWVDSVVDAFLCGKERSLIRRNLPGEDFLGIMPMRLTCKSGIEPVGNGPKILLFDTSVLIYFEMISRLSVALGRLIFADWRL